VIHFLNVHDFPAVAEFSTVPMILYCPATYCNERHIDAGDFAEKPHHTHACQRCGHVWRPAVLNTHGVQFLPGFKG
jgi:rubredoxin